MTLGYFRLFSPYQHLRPRKHHLQIRVIGCEGALGGFYELQESMAAISLMGMSCVYPYISVSREK